MTGEMVVMMLVGVWLLVQQLFWTTMAEEMKLRSPMVDPLMRRSPLEKNFMRFGRSWNPTDDSNLPTSNDLDREALSYKLSKDSVDGFLRAQKDKDNFIRFGKADPEITLSEQLSRLNRARDNFLRFGRSKDNFMRFGRAKDSFMRFGRDNFIRLRKGKTDFMRFGRAEPMEKLQEAIDNLKDDKLRIGRSTSNNFMRFGRDYEPEFPRWERNTKTGFMRFGRDKSLVRIGRHRQSDKGDGFIRFGRSQEDDSAEEDEGKRVKRSYESYDDKVDEEDPPKELDYDLMSERKQLLNKVVENCDKEKSPACVADFNALLSLCPSLHQSLYGNLPSVILGPDLPLLPIFPLNKRAKSKQNFIRLG